MTVYEDDEIDLKPYIKALIQKWWLILIFVLAGAALGFGFSRISAEQYEATSIILLTKQISTLYLASELPTKTEPSDSRSRTDTILTIAESDAIVTKVLEETADQWPPDQELTLESFKNIVSIEVVGDTIVIKVSADDPNLAEEIANTWAQILIESVNQAYSGEQPLELVIDQRETAQVDYEDAQSTLEKFLQTSQIEALEQKLSELRTVSDGLANDRATLFNYFENRKADMLALQIQAAGLQAQLENGNQSNAGAIGDALAVLLARANALNLTRNQTQIKTVANNTQINTDASVPEQPVISPQTITNLPAISVQINDLEALRDSSSNYQADLADLISIAKAEQDAAEEAITTLTQAILDGEVNSLLEENLTQIREIQAQLESEQATYTELQNARDLNWTAFKALLAKEAEIKNAPKASNYVVLISPAIPPDEASPRGTLKNMVILAGAGFFTSIMLILGNTWWKSAQIFAPEDNDLKSTNHPT